MMAYVSVVATSLLFGLPVVRCHDSESILTKYYNLLGEARKDRWNKLLDYVGDDPEYLWGYGSWLVLMVTYWVVGGIFTFFDLTNKPDALRRYKVQPGTNEPLTFKNLCKVLGLVLFNQTVITLPVALYLGRAMLLRGSPPIRELPPFHTTVSHIIMFVLIEEIGFYYSHRLLHHRWIYKYVHKKHHEWTAPIAIVALYAHPVEHIFSNLLPPFLGVFILKSHIFTALLWFGLAIAFTLSEHSGYHLPFFPSSEAHDFHHLKFTNCFGVLGILDWFHGTDLEFKKTMSHPRHRILKGLTPARELYPDAAAKKTTKKKKRS